MAKPGDQDKQSIWKKEISLGRKAKEKAPRVVATPLQPAKPGSLDSRSQGAEMAKPGDQDKQSVWKKEITLGRKAREKAPRVLATPLQPAKPESTDSGFGCNGVATTRGFFSFGFRRSVISFFQTDCLS